MQWTLRFLLITVLTVGLVVSCSEDDNPITPEVGSIVITSTPTGATVMVNDSARGTTPYTFSGSPGSYQLALLLDGYDRWEQNVTIRNGVTDTVPVQLHPRILSKITVTSTPSEAEVWLDARKLSPTPMVLTADTGQHLLVVKYDGFVPWDTSFMLNAPDTFAVHATLTKVAGAIHITSQPIGAAISINSAATGLVTPATVPDLPPEAHIVQLTLQGYDDWQRSVTVVAFDTVSVHADLSQQTGSLDISSDPVGAAILLDGQATGAVTPNLMTGIAVGNHDLGLRLDGYIDWDTTITISRDTTIITTSLIRLVGSIEVTSSPSGASVYLDGVETGLQTPASLQDIATGQHDITLVLDGYVDWSGQVTVAPQQTAMIHADLRLSIGTVSIISDPAGAAVFLNDSGTGLTTPAVIDSLPTDSYSVRLELAGYESQSKTVEIRAYDTSDVHMNLVLITGTLYFSSVPSGADVLVDGDSIGHATPASEALVPDTYDIRYHLYGYYDWDTTVTVTAYQRDTVAAALQRLPTTLVIESSPPGAQIWIDDAATGFTTPHTFDDITWGDYDITVYLPGHYRFDTTVVLPLEMSTTLAPTLMTAPDFTYAVTFGSTIYEVGADGMIRDTIATDYDDYIASYVSHYGEILYSPDGQYLLYTGDNYPVTLRHADGTFIRGFGGNRSTDFSWSPYSDEFSYSRYCGPIYRYEIADDWFTTIKGGCYVHCPAYNPDATRIMYIVHNFGRKAWINTMNVDGSGARTEYGSFGTNFDENLQVHWINDSTATFKIAGTAIYRLVMPDSGSNMVTRILTDNVSRYWLSRNFQYGAYTANDGIYFFEVDDGTPQRITQRGAYDVAVTNDGRYLVCRTGDGVHIIDTDRTDVHALKWPNAGRGAVDLLPQ